MTTTILTLATGQRYEIAGAYEDTAIALKGASSYRELTKADGGKLTVAPGTWTAIEEQAARKHRLGFA